MTNLIQELEELLEATKTAKRLPGVATPIYFSTKESRSVATCLYHNAKAILEVLDKASYMAEFKPPDCLKEYEWNGVTHFHRWEMLTEALERLNK